MLLFEFPESFAVDGVSTHINLGYTNDVFAKLKAKLERCRFMSVMTHMAIDVIPEICETVSNDNILASIENDTLRRPPLQKNTVYFFCKLTDINENSDIFKLLKRSNAEYKLAYLKLDSLSLYEKDYFEEVFSQPITKDITIINDSTGEEVGWYNIRSNILWMSDIGHNKETAVKHISYLLDRIHEYQVEGEIRILPDLTIGADPEFEILATKISSPAEGDGKAISAQTIFQNGLTSEIGHNGNPDTGEIRPRFANHPLRLARNIKRTVKKLVRNPVLEDYSMYAGGGWTKQLGGHIHFNIRSMPEKLKYVLFDLIGRHVKEGMDRSGRKDSSSYMTRSGSEVIRPTESHEGVEWRFLPSFIVSDEISKAILCTTWAIIKAYYANEIPETNESLTAEQVINIIKKISLYDTYKSHIDKFIDLFIIRRTSMEGIDLKDGWNIKSIPRQSNVRIFSNIEWVNRYFTPVNVDIPHKISINIELNSNDNELMFMGNKLNKEILDIIEQFADSHFVACKYVNGKGNKGKNCKVELYLPYAWRVIKNTELAFDIMKNLIQKIILILSEKVEREGE